MNPWREAIWQAVPAGTRPERFEERRAFLLDAVRPGDRVLDLGVGDGAFATALLDGGAAVSGVDVAEEALRRARAQAPAADLRLVAEGEPLPFAEDAFDVVWAGEVLEHVADVVGLLADVRRVLRWGGTLLVTTPRVDRLALAGDGARAGALGRRLVRPARRPPAVLLGPRAARPAGRRRLRGGPDRAGRRAGAAVAGAARPRILSVGPGIIDDGMIDVHCHVLPGIDDGPRTMEDAVALARVAHGNGIGTLVATPHVSPVHVDNDAARIAQGVAEVRAALAQEGIPVDVTTGAEVALGRVVDLDDDELAGLRLGGGPWLLLECPLSPAAAYGFPTAARHVAARGHRVLLAHPERSPAFHADPAGTLGPLVEEGMLAQVTAGAFVGRFGRRVQEVAMELLGAGLLHAAASDAHDHVSRPPSIAARAGGGGGRGVDGVAGLRGPGRDPGRRHDPAGAGRRPARPARRAQVVAARPASAGPASPRRRPATARRRPGRPAAPPRGGAPCSGRPCRCRRGARRPGGTRRAAPAARPGRARPRARRRCAGARRRRRRPRRPRAPPAGSGRRPSS